MKKIILHIGTEKTGSTSIQHALAHDRDALAAKGVLYPKLFGSENHMEIAVAAMNDNVNDELRQSELTKANCGLDEYRQRLADQLSSEIEASNCHTLVISNEHCHSRLREPIAIERLKDFLTQITPNIEIIVYLRRQDRLAVSLHSTRVKLGGQGETFPSWSNGHLGFYFSFDRLLDRYARVFGAASIHARLFEPRYLTGGDVVADFYAQTELDLPVPTLPRANTSLSAKQCLFLERFNEDFPLVKNGKINPMRGPIFSVISKTCTGAPMPIIRAEAEAFYRPFREGNAMVREKYFPDLDRATLFDESFENYPENMDSVVLTNDDMFEFVSAIWKHARTLAKRNGSG